jgi:hypothetical protein
MVNPQKVFGEHQKCVCFYTPLVSNVPSHVEVARTMDTAIVCGKPQTHIVCCDLHSRLIGVLLF